MAKSTLTMRSSSFDTVKFVLWLSLCVCLVAVVSPWAPPMASLRSTGHVALVRTTCTTTHALPSLLDNDEWRQYVPLAVSAAVLLDILLGSPLANGVAQRLRSSATTETTKENRPRVPDQLTMSKERIDSQKVAQEAIQKAQYTLELRAMLEAQRDPVQELQRRTEEQTALLQQNQAQLQAQLEREKEL